MAATCTLADKASRNLREIKWSWTSHTDGTATGTGTTGTTAFVSQALTGKVVGFIADPGSTAPSAGWDCEILDANGYDVLNGQGLNMDASATTVVMEALLGRYVVYSPLTLSITNAGSGKVGVCILYLESND